jgi:hypothetical protein
MNREIDEAVRALGPFADVSAGERLIHWARELARGIALVGAA